VRAFSDEVREQSKAVLVRYRCVKKILLFSVSEVQLIPSLRIRELIGVEFCSHQTSHAANLYRIVLTLGFQKRFAQCASDAQNASQSIANHTDVYTRPSRRDKK
jgi:hypothetical protein